MRLGKGANLTISKIGKRSQSHEKWDWKNERENAFEQSKELAWDKGPDHKQEISLWRPPKEYGKTKDLSSYEPLSKQYYHPRSYYHGKQELTPAPTGVSTATEEWTTWEGRRQSSTTGEDWSYDEAVIWKLLNWVLYFAILVDRVTIVFTSHYQIINSNSCANWTAGHSNGPWTSNFKFYEVSSLKKYNMDIEPEF